MDDTDELGGVLEDLGRVSRTLDAMWRTAVRDGTNTAVHLSEASHGVHRAIIALSAPPDDRSSLATARRRPAGHLKVRELAEE